MLEKSRRLVCLPLEDPPVSAGGLEVILRQQGELERGVLLRGAEKICLPILIHKKGHVACHLPLFKIPPEGGAVTFLDLPRILEPRIVLPGKRGLARGVEILRPGAGVRAEASEIGVGARHLVGHRHPGARAGIAAPLEFQMKPHDKLPGLRVVNHLGPFQHASLRDLRTGISGNSEGYALILPMTKIIGGIAVDADMGAVSLRPGGLVLAKPVVAPLVGKNPAAVRIDGHPLVIKPDLTGRNDTWGGGICGGSLPGGSLRRNLQAEQERNEEAAKGGHGRSGRFFYGQGGRPAEAVTITMRSL